MQTRVPRRVCVGCRLHCAAPPVCVGCRLHRARPPGVCWLSSPPCSPPGVCVGVSAARVCWCVGVSAAAARVCWFARRVGKVVREGQSGRPDRPYPDIPFFCVFKKKYIRNTTTTTQAHFLRGMMDFFWRGGSPNRPGFGDVTRAFVVRQAGREGRSGRSVGKVGSALSRYPFFCVLKIKYIRNTTTTAQAQFLRGMMDFFGGGVPKSAGIWGCDARACPPTGPAKLDSALFFKPEPALKPAWPPRLSRRTPPARAEILEPAWPARLARLARPPGPAARLKRSPTWPEFTSGYDAPPKPESDRARVCLWLRRPA